MGDYKASKDAYKQAIPGSYGILSLIAERLKLTRGAVCKYVETHPDVSELVRQEREKQIDLAEGVIFNKMRERDFDAAKFTVSRLGKHRGWTERQELEHSGQQPVGKIEVEIIDRTVKKTTPSNNASNEGLASQ